MSKKSKKESYLKLIIQYLTLVIFIFLISITIFPSKEHIPLDIFLRLDPLIAIGTSIATWEVIDKAFIALSIIIITLFLGRIFCGYICPLGTTIDLSEKLFIKNPKKKLKALYERSKRFRKNRNIKYYILIILLSSALFGLSLLYIFDPISLITRTITHFFYPLIIYISNFFLDLLRPLASKLGYIELSHKYYIQPVFGSNLVIFLIFITIIFLIAYQPRFWCRYLCPLGALLGIFSKTAIIKRCVSEKCNECSICQINCPMDAIKDNPRETVQSECIQCLSCVKVCPEKAVDFRVVSPLLTGYNSEINFSRRSLLYSFGSGLVLSFMAKTNMASAKINGKLLRPPGSIPEDEFLMRCIRCGECIKSCITNTLQPALFESGFEGLWSPKHIMRLAGCEQQCNLCGQVCPTQAIRSLPLEERKYARVGTAVIIRDRCIAWEQDKLCIICDEQCPYNAIVFKNIEGFKRPFIDESKCNGCGICEQKCPIAGESAIIIWPLGEIRLKEGSYIKEAERLKLRFKEEKDVLDLTTLTESPLEIIRSEPKNLIEPNKSKLPSGFTFE